MPGRLKGIYPRIFDDEKQGAQARQLFADANALLDRIVEQKLLTARGVYGFFPANAVGDDVELYSDASAHHGAGTAAFPASAGESGRERAVPLAGGLYRAEGDGSARSPSAPLP